LCVDFRIGVDGCGCGRGRGCGRDKCVGVGG